MGVEIHKARGGARSLPEPWSPPGLAGSAALHVAAVPGRYDCVADASLEDKGDPPLSLWYLSHFIRPCTFLSQLAYHFSRGLSSLVVPE